MKITEIKKCRICGTELPEKASFCFNCGANQEDSEQGNINYVETTETIQEDNKEPEKTKEKRKLSKTIFLSIGSFISMVIGGALGTMLGGFFWFSAIIALIEYFIMRKVLKMHGFEFYIVFISILHVCMLSIGVISLVVLDEYSIIELLMNLSIDIFLSTVMVVSACFFYVKKSNLWLIILMVFETFYLILNVFNLYIQIYLYDSYMIISMVLHIILRAAVIILGIIYILFIKDPERKKEIPLENTQQSIN